MQDFLDQPAGDFDWGPQTQRWLPRRAGDPRDAVAAFWPLLAVVLGAALLTIGAMFTWSQTAKTQSVEKSPATLRAETHPDAEDTDSVAVASLAPTIVVHVTGLVERPGIVAVPPDSRAADAVAAAGGSLPDADLSRVNLAAPAADGMQLHVPPYEPTPQPIPPPPEPTPQAEPEPTPPEPTQIPEPPTHQPEPTPPEPTQIPEPPTPQPEPTPPEPTQIPEPPTPQPEPTPPEPTQIPAPPTPQPEPMPPELEAFLLSQTGEPSREALTAFLEQHQLDN